MLTDDIKILMVDDDRVTTDYLTPYLQEAGYEIKIARDGNTGLSVFRNFLPDIVILNSDLPKKDGYALCREIRSQSDCAIVFLTLHSELHDVIYGLDLGADDYLSKPIEPKLLIARLHAITRRTHFDSSRSNNGWLIFDHMAISISEFRLKIDDEIVKIPRKELELLYYLCSNPNRVFTRNQILDKIWGFDSVGTTRTVDVHIRRLRQKLKGVSDRWEIQTVYAVGYKFLLKERNQ